MGKLKEFIKSYIPLWVLISFFILSSSVLLYLFSAIFSGFADFINGSISHALRFLLSKISTIVHFSLFEVCIILALPLLALLIFLALRGKKDFKRMLRGVFNLLGIIAVLYSLYLFMLAIGYRTTPLSQRLKLDERAEISKEELYSLTERIRDEVNSLEGEITFEDGESRICYDLDTLSEKLTEGYERVSKKYPFIPGFSSRVKPVAFSGVMSDMGIMGIYGYFTGEANINTSYPDYTVPYTAAHEMAHQRGIARENEANFVAFLVCIECDDAYIKYSGYLNLYEYLASALYRTDKELYKEILAGLSERALGDLRASAAISESHKDSFINKVMDKVNDFYLKSNGTEGSVSYGYVVRLAAAYYRE